MAQAYSQTERENDPHALPDLEVWYVGKMGPRRAFECPLCSELEDDRETHETEHVGYYWQACFPGCLPDGEASGPFATEAEAIADAREGMED